MLFDKNNKNSKRKIVPICGCIWCLLFTRARWLDGSESHCASLVISTFVGL